MKSRRLLLRLLIGLAVAGLFWLGIHLMRMTPEPGKPLQTLGTPDAQSAPSREAPPMTILPSGRQRPLTMTLPFGGTVTGAYWSENAYLLTDSKGTELQGDVLYDEKQQALLVRQGNEALATRPIPENMPTFMAEWILSVCRDMPYQQETAPKITKMEILPMAFDIPGAYSYALTEALGYGHSRAQQTVPTPSGIGELTTTYNVRVSMDDRPALNVLVRISTEGRNRESTHDSYYPKPLDPVGRGFNLSTNRHGAVVRYFFAIRTPEGEVRRDDPWLVTEGWEHGCPWKEGELDPIIGDNLLSELVIPQTFQPSLSSREFPWLGRRTDVYARERERVMAAKAKRLEQELASPQK